MHSSRKGLIAPEKESFQCSAGKNGPKTSSDYTYTFPPLQQKMLPILLPLEEELCEYRITEGIKLSPFNRQEEDFFAQHEQYAALSRKCVV